MNGTSRMASGIVVTDLDGTLLRSDRTVSARDRATLERLAAQGVIRVVATGRSWFSVRAVLAPDFPIDYLVFSAGVGIVDWRRQCLIRGAAMSGGEVRLALEALARLGLDCMVHDLLPDNQKFGYLKHSRDVNPDFDRRITRYRDHAAALVPGVRPTAGASQIVAIVARPDEALYRAASREMPQLEVVRTTSPLDGRSMWIEIYPRGISKSSGAAWIARRDRVERASSLSIGNDYNDSDLLEWASTSFVVSNAPGALTRAHAVVASNDDHGFSEAVSRWRE